MHRPDRLPDLQVELRLFATASGGPQQPLPQGCRLPNDFGLPGELNDGMYIFNADPPGPGQTALAELWLLAPERNAGRLYEGFKFFLWNGRLIGEGIVRKVVNPDLSSQTGSSHTGDQV